MQIKADVQSALVCVNLRSLFILTNCFYEKNND